MKPSDIDFFLPKMRCDHGCGECCGLALATQVEFDRVVAFAKANNIEPVKQGTRCPWYQDGQCSVYQARPTVCRIFGHVDRMVCPRGYNTNVAEAVEKRLINGMKRDATGAVRLLHEVVYGLPELNELVRKSLAGAAQMTIDGKPIAAIKPAAMDYTAARTLKLVGVGFQDSVFVDEKTGEIT